MVLSTAMKLLWTILVQVSGSLSMKKARPAQCAMAVTRTSRRPVASTARSMTTWASAREAAPAWMAVMARPAASTSRRTDSSMVSSSAERTTREPSAA